MKTRKSAVLLALRFRGGFARQFAQRIGLHDWAMQQMGLEIAEYRQFLCFMDRFLVASLSAQGSGLDTYKDIYPSPPPLVGNYYLCDERALLV